MVQNGTTDAKWNVFCAREQQQLATDEDKWNKSKRSCDEAPDEEEISEISTEDPHDPIEPSVTLAMLEPEQPVKPPRWKHSVERMISSVEERMRRTKRETSKGKEFWSGVRDHT